MDLNKECRSFSDVQVFQGRVQWGGLERAARLVLSAEGNCFPAQLDGSHQDFFCFQPLPWDFLWGRYNHLHTTSCQPCDSYIVPGLVCLQVNIFKLSLFPTEDGLGLTVKTRVPSFEGYFENGCVCRDRISFIMQINNAAPM